MSDAGSSLTYGLHASGDAATVGGLELTLRPADVHLATSDVAGAEATLTFDPYGASAPRLRLVATDGSTIAIDGDGTIRIRGGTESLGFVPTDLTGSPVTTIAPAILDPAAIIDRYRIGTIVLEQDSLYASRSARLAALGFRQATSFGPYVAFTAPAAAGPRE